MEPEKLTLLESIATMAQSPDEIARAPKSTSAVLAKVEALLRQPATEEQLARAIYRALGHEEVEPWSRAKKTREFQRMKPPYSRNQLDCLTAARTTLEVFAANVRDA